MKATILFLLLIMAVSTSAEKWKITRYEQKSDALFICINHTNKPVYVEHFLTAEERKDTAAITATVERLVAELYIKADEYKEAERFASKPERAKRIENKTDSLRIAIRKMEILERRQAVRDSIALAQKDTIVLK